VDFCGVLDEGKFLANKIIRFRWIFGDRKYPESTFKTTKSVTLKISEFYELNLALWISQIKL
jgi:hypothetical protein